MVFQIAVHFAVWLFALKRFREKLWKNRRYNNKVTPVSCAKRCGQRRMLKRVFIRRLNAPGFNFCAAAYLHTSHFPPSAFFGRLGYLGGLQLTISAPPQTLAAGTSFVADSLVVGNPGPSWENVSYDNSGGPPIRYLTSAVVS
jgi:hypothetical protein